MRFDITFRLTDSYQNLLPINYQYPLSSWIYRTLERADAIFSERLHNEGFGLGMKQFKLFTFSQLRFGRNGYKIVRPDRLKILNNTCWLTVSMTADEAIRPFILGLFKELSFSIGDKISQVPMEVYHIQNLEVPAFEEDKAYHFKALSPICVSENIDGNPQPQYLSPEDEHFERIFVHNLYHKYLAMKENDLLNEEDFLPDDWESRVSFRLLGQPRKKVISIKAHTPQQTKYRAYQFDFELCAPKLLLDIGYQAGFGEKNSMGFGCCGVVV